MPISTVNRVKPIIVSILPAADNTIVPIYQGSSLMIGNELFPNYIIVGLNVFIKNLKAYGSIKSLIEAPLPNFLATDSETDKLKKTLDIEWTSPRKQLNVFIGNQVGWQQVGSLSFLNNYGYPFRAYNLMDLFTDTLAIELGDSSRIGVSFQDVGYGVLENIDTVTVHGSYVEEIIVKSPETNVIVTFPSSGGSSGGNTGTGGATFGNNVAVGNNTTLGN